MDILTFNLVFSTLVFWIAARLYVLLRLADLKPQTLLLPILLLHSFRHLGLMFLAPGATEPEIPLLCAYPAALGDLLAAIVLATLSGAPAYMGAAYWIPAFWVPALLVTHCVTFVFLWRTRLGRGTAELAPVGAW